MKLSGQQRLIGATVASTCLLLLSACGGSGGSSAASVGTGGAGVQTMWQQPGGGVSAQLPNAVQTVRLVFEAQNGSSCCVAINPDTVPPDSTGNRSVLLDDLPSGPGTFMLAGFATTFAPAPAGITDLCATIPAGVGQPCDPSQPASPSFESGAEPVTIIPNMINQVSDVQVSGVPFVLNPNPSAGAEATNPPTFTFIVADAIGQIDPSSITLDVDTPEDYRRLLESRQGYG